MRKHSLNLIFGIILLLLGGLFLANNFDMIYLDEEMTSAAVFFVAGAVFLGAYLFQKKKIWLMIIGLSGIFIGSAVYIEETRMMQDDFIGIIFFVLAGIAFLNTLRFGKKHWWAVIPGGMCFIFAGHIYIGEYLWLPDEYHGILFNAGVGLIFAILYFMKDEKYRLGWAKYPAIVGFAVASIIVIGADIRDGFSDYFVPAVFVLVGGFLVYNALKRKEKSVQVKSRESSVTDEIVQMNDELNQNSSANTDS